MTGKGNGRQKWGQASYGWANHRTIKAEKRRTRKLLLQQKLKEAKRDA